ncbi:MAG: hypothetical protein KGJ13_07905 [Patescibacteria group bacterium]|nr:hypothetical protein [Patescibacteria group bacterium]
MSDRDYDFIKGTTVTIQQQVRNQPIFLLRPGKDEVLVLTEHSAWWLHGWLKEVFKEEQ